MDYKGNYFKDDDEQDGYPHKSKTGKRIKLAFKIFIYSISLFIYAIILFAIFSSCDPGMMSKMHFSDQARALAEKNPDTFTVYKVQPKDFMNYYATVQLKSIYYAEAADELEVGVQFNLDKITGGKVDNALVFVLTDSEGNYYPAVNLVTASNRKYGYARIAFDGVSLNIKDNDYYKFTTSYDYLSEYQGLFNSDTQSNNEEEMPPNEDGITYKISIYSYEKIAGKDYATVVNGIVNVDYEKFLLDKPDAISEHTIYSNSTVITLVEYNR